jgi:hypothetical protein
MDTMNDNYDDVVQAVAQSWLKHKASDGVRRTIFYLTAADMSPAVLPDGKVVKVTVEFVPEDETRPC